jgi:hypothetical protein
MKRGQNICVGQLYVPRKKAGEKISFPQLISLHSLSQIAFIVKFIVIEILSLVGFLWLAWHVAQYESRL